MTSPTPYVVGPYDSVHVYMQWGGKLPGNEEWSCGLRFSGSGSATAAALAGINGAAVACTNYHQRATTSISGAAKLSYVKLNAIGTDGTYVEDSTNEVTVADISGGGAGTFVAVPNQIALAVSLTTGFSRGPAHRGRYYLPMPMTEVATDGLISASVAQAVGVSTDTFLSDLSTIMSGWTPSVFSRKSGAAAHRAITGNEVGRVLDTQRRRRRSLIEDYR